MLHWGRLHTLSKHPVWCTRRTKRHQSSQSTVWWGKLLAPHSLTQIFHLRCQGSKVYKESLFRVFCSFSLSVLDNFYYKLTTMLLAVATAIFIISASQLLSENLSLGVKAEPTGLGIVSEMDAYLEGPEGPDYLRQFWLHPWFQVHPSLLHWSHHCSVWKTRWFEFKTAWSPFP